MEINTNTVAQALELGKPPRLHVPTEIALAFSSLRDPVTCPVSSAHPKFPSAFSPPCLLSQRITPYVYGLAGTCWLVRRGSPGTRSDCEAHASSLSPGEVFIHSPSFTQVSVFTKLVGT